MEVQIVLCLCVLLHCQKLTSSFTGNILFSTHTAIMEFDIDTRNVTVLVEQSDTVYAMDYDYKNQFIYFPRFSTHDIVRFAYPSKNRTLQTVIQSSPHYPSGIAVDPTNDHIYWIDFYVGRLSRCNLDGSNVTVLSSLSLPFVIRLDLTNRWMFIVEYEIGIIKSRFDLLENETIVNCVSSQVYCMDIDTDEQRLYWIINGNGDMKSATFNGSDAKTILSTNFAGYKWAIGVLGSNIFYADNRQLLMVAKTPGSTPTVLYTDTRTIESIFVFNQSGM
ncbi:low-density lipoprotein receptor-related protein 8-like isoform X1 [Mytilus trossulus]|uniref:low-density lipoprotein receptor-related protein 8-like isoform X1 n=1 Tax=Mytilus trossulus TaxID=6551 RepID=UPI003003E1DB